MSTIPGCRTATAVLRRSGRVPGRSWCLPGRRTSRGAAAIRGKGVGHALVDAALTWAYDHGYQSVSVDFDTANPLSRPFWLKNGFHPAGYGLLRFIDGRATGQPGIHQNLPAATEI